MNKKFRINGYGIEMKCDDLETAKMCAKTIAQIGAKKYEYSQFVFIYKIDYVPEGSYLLGKGYIPY